MISLFILPSFHILYATTNQNQQVIFHIFGVSGNNTIHLLNCNFYLIQICMYRIRSNILCAHFGTLKQGRDWTKKACNRLIMLTSEGKKKEKKRKPELWIMMKTSLTNVYSMLRHCPMETVWDFKLIYHDNEVMIISKKFCLINVTNKWLNHLFSRCLWW